MKALQDAFAYKQKLARLKILLSLYEQGLIELRFADESGFSLVACIAYGWQQKGEQVSITPKKGKKLNLLGLMNLQGVLYVAGSEKSIDAAFVVETFNKFAQSISKPTVIVMDNAPIHDCTLVKEAIAGWEENGLFIFFLPKYSPHLNLIEILWRKIKYEWLKPADYASFSKLKKAVKTICKRFGTEFKIDFKDPKLLFNSA